MSQGAAGRLRYAFTARFVAVGVGYGYGALVLPLSRELGVGTGTASGVFAVTVMVFCLVSAPAGTVADRRGPRLVLALGSASLAAGLVLTASAEGAVALYLGHGLLSGCRRPTCPWWRPSVPRSGGNDWWRSVWPSPGLEWGRW